MHPRVVLDGDWRMQMRPPTQVAARGAKSHVAAQLRAAQRQWLERVREHTRSDFNPKGLSLTQIAKRSGLSDSTLTRFFNAEHYDGALSALTIRQISEATGYPATAEALGEPAGPVGAASATGEAEPFASDAADPVAEAVRAMIAATPGVDPWTLKSRALEAEGYMPGDIVVVDMNAQPRAGDVVCAQVYDWARGRAETIFRFFEPPFLVIAGKAEDRRPRLVDDQNVMVRGVVIASLRRRAAA